jgi:hypothetical protein
MYTLARKVPSVNSFFRTMGAPTMKNAAGRIFSYSTDRSCSPPNRNPIISKRDIYVKGDYHPDYHHFPGCFDWLD